MSWKQIFRRKKWDEERARELETHLDHEIADNIARGMSSEDARHAAHKKLGNRTLIREEIYRMNSLNIMEALWQDLRYGVRVLAKNPSVTAIMILTLALAIGANTAIFSVVYGVLLRPLPYPQPERIVTVSEANAKYGQMDFADPNFEDMRAFNRSLAGIAEYSARTVSISGGAEPTRTMTAWVSKDFFDVMRVQPVMGRTFAAEEQRPGAAPVALVSYNYWQQFLSSNPKLSELRLKTEGKILSVAGVMPAGFHFPEDSEVWIPREIEERYPSRTAHNWAAVGRLRDGVALTQARADLGAIAHRLKEQYGADTDMTDVAIVPMQDSLTGAIQPALQALLGAVVFLLLVACANVANLLLAQASARESELAIRSALGAARGRLVRQLLAEAFLLAAIGGILGVLGANWGLDALLALAPKDLPRLNEVSINLPVLFFAFGVAVVVAAGLGIFTAVRATSGDVRAVLVEGGRGQAGTQRSQRLGRAIAAAQLAITLVMLVGAGLLGRSLLRVLSVKPGFRTEQIVAIDLTMPPAENPQGRARNIGFLNTLFDRLKTIPGVQEVGGANTLPLSRGLADGTFLAITAQQMPKSMEEFGAMAKNPELTGYADFCVATEDYFPVLGIPLIRGRLFDERDGSDAPHAAVISESLAQKKWPKQDPLGRTIEFGNMDGDVRLLTIVGIVGDIRERSLEKPPRATVYVNYKQRPAAASHFTVMVRSQGDTAAVISAARGFVRELDPEIPPRLSTFEQVYAESMGSRRFNLTLVGVFAATALLLAVAGIYGVMAYGVSRRTREIGVRMALGATQGHVLRMVLGQGMITISIGIALGVAFSLALTRTIESLLFGVSATDPVTFAGVAILLAMAGLIACWVPARRATRVDPMIALRYE
jgi:predicted permease